MLFCHANNCRLLWEGHRCVHYNSISMCHYHHQVAVRILTDCHLPKHISNATSRISSSVGSNLTCTVQQNIVISKQCVFVLTHSHKRKPSEKNTSFFVVLLCFYKNISLVKETEAHVVVGLLGLFLLLFFLLLLLLGYWGKKNTVWLV